MPSCRDEDFAKKVGLVVCSRYCVFIHFGVSLPPFKRKIATDRLSIDLPYPFYSFGFIT